MIIISNFHLLLGFHIETDSSFRKMTHKANENVFLWFLFISSLLPLVEERVVGPRDLQVSEVAHSSLRLTWTQATSDVTGYRLFVAPLNSKGQPLYPQQRQVGDIYKG